ncbi:hypothetical protein Strop_0700 [Salinispora tropica CNB-440]|uniref:Uncharacterized protein n=1 Tax=Salinispora tropica (strain ATCC BAA-916 / DSM 44818 / JCM 13857 / NBRC 105044 / CNB-440) TaxID=369723 RepID=A4X2S7_SALTO|nr:hypothetical protein Strop_0700 [Salinispora tropica CNB-440]
MAQTTGLAYGPHPSGRGDDQGPAPRGAGPWSVGRWSAGGVAAGGDPVREVFGGEPVLGGVRVRRVGDPHLVAGVAVAGDGDVVAAGEGVAVAAGVGGGAGDVGHDGAAVVNGADDVLAQGVGLRVVGHRGGDLDAAVHVGAGLGVQHRGDVVDGVGAGFGGAHPLGHRVNVDVLALYGQGVAGGGGAAVVEVRLGLVVDREHAGAVALALRGGLRGGGGEGGGRGGGDGATGGDQASSGQGGLAKDVGTHGDRSLPLGGARERGGAPAGQERWFDEKSGGPAR